MIPRRAVALVGLRCSGKTTVGRALAELLGIPFVDLDEEIVRRRGDVLSGASPVTAGTLLVRWGEPAFRRFETDALEHVLGRPDPFVLATGGGVVLASTNRAQLAKNAWTVWLDVEVAELRRRMERSDAIRPSLTGADARDEIEAVLAQRAALYSEVADATVEGTGKEPAEVAREVRDWLARLPTPWPPGG